MAFLDIYKGLIYVIFIFAGVHCKSCPYPAICGPGMKTPGYTCPSGDITLEYGEDLVISCILFNNNKYGKNASSLMSFKWGNKLQPVDIINSTAIQLRINKHPKTGSSDYACYVGDDFVCHNVVVIGVKPQNVTDFDCVGYNYENFTCTWTSPENYVKTNYTIEYILPNVRSARHASGCPKIVSDDNNKWSCTWSLATTPLYRHVHELFTFRLIATNIFGSLLMNFSINHFSHVIPNPPENLTAESLSPHSIKLNWVIPTNLRHFPGGLNYRVSYWTHGRNTWKTLYNINSYNKTEKMEYELIDLPYAHYLYDIRVSMKSKNAVGERFWSQNASVALWTKSKLPERPPKTDIGSFEYLEGSHRIIYWQKIQDYEENGSNFSYHIEIEGHPKIKPKKLNFNYAKFENLVDHNYTFKIWSKNDIGLSESYSVVFVPATYYAVKEPESLVKVDKGHSLYELEWSNNNDEKITNYTIFWCNDRRDRPYQCDGSLQWKTVDKEITNDTLQLNEEIKDQYKENIYQLAISANGHHTSSGMLWAECTVIPGRGVKLRQVYVKSVTSRSIMVAWKLDCVKKGDVTGFNITYCPTVPLPESADCQNQTSKYASVTDSKAEEGIIRDLKPYTRYKIKVKPILNGSESQFSEAMFNSTFEDSPTKPRNLKVINVSNSSVFIEWQKPVAENGYIRHYNVYFANRVEKVDSEKTKNTYKINLDKLNPSTNYTVHVEACTVRCSDKTNLAVTTEVGWPGLVQKPSANWEDSRLVLRWNKPASDASVNYFQIWISTSNREQLFIHADDQVWNVTEQVYNVTICDNDKFKNVYVRIRAVNILAGKVLEGPWSERAEFPCFRSASTETWTIIIVIMSVVIFLSLMAYLAKRFWNYILNMRDVPVKLPDGLAAVVENFQEKEKHSDETIPSDEPLLSKKCPSQSRNLSGESSGCSSGHESVASSIESRSHLSASDSGTEQPRSPSLGEGECRDVALRQRVTKPNVKKSDYVTMPEVSPDSWSLKQNSGGYSVIGLVPPTKKPEIVPEYMPLTDIPSKISYEPITVPPSSEHALVSPDRPTSSGYVPYMPQESPLKNSDTVLTGLPTKNVIISNNSFTPKEETSPECVKVSPMETPMPMLFLWQDQSPVESSSRGYVVVGDPKPHKVDLDLQTGSKGYIPHNKFQATKSLKED